MLPRAGAPAGLVPGLGAHQTHHKSRAAGHGADAEHRQRQSEGPWFSSKSGPQLAGVPFMQAA